jgi:hypothetical protein
MTLPGWRGYVLVCARCGLQDPADCGRDIDCKFSESDELVEVMPVSDHEELRAAAQAVVDEVRDWYPSVRRLREVLDSDE